MDPDLQRIRELGEQQRADGDGRYSRELRERVSTWIERRREQGAWWTEIACEVGLPRRTVRRWAIQKPPVATLEAPVAPVALVPIDVVGKVANEVATVAIVSPSGFRIEGMSLAEAIEALRRLG